MSTNVATARNVTPSKMMREAMLASRQHLDVMKRLEDQLLAAIARANATYMAGVKAAAETLLANQTGNEEETVTDK